MAATGDIMRDPVFRTRDLIKTYSSGPVTVTALGGVDLDLLPAELTVLLGPSGSGKSTLLNILGGLDHATSGRVWFRDLELTALSDRRLTRPEVAWSSPPRMLRRDRKSVV